MEKRGWKKLGTLFEFLIRRHERSAPKVLDVKVVPPGGLPGQCIRDASELLLSPSNLGLQVPIILVPWL